MADIGDEANKGNIADIVQQEKNPSIHAEKTDYTLPVEDPYGKAMKYLSKHDIFGLFQGITAGIVYSRPEQPLNFMVSELEKMQEQDQLQKGVIRQASEPESTPIETQQGELETT